MKTLRIVGTEHRWAAHTHEPVVEVLITRKQAEDLGLIDPLPRTPDEVLYHQLNAMTPDALREEMFLAGNTSVEGKRINKIGWQVLNAKCAKQANDDAENDVEKAKAGYLDGTSCPAAIIECSGVSESPVFGAAAHATIDSNSTAPHIDVIPDHCKPPKAPERE